MNTTHAEDATTWRNLTDQLTPGQVTDLEEQERQGADCSPDAYRKWLIGEAREFIADNERDAELAARIQPPAGATSVGGWDSETEGGHWCRSIQWATFGAGATAVDIDGLQDDTGAVDGPYLSVYGLEGGGQLTAAAARQLAATLTEAADEFERLSETG